MKTILIILTSLLLGCDGNLQSLDEMFEFPQQETSIEGPKTKCPECKECKECPVCQQCPKPTSQDELLDKYCGGGEGHIGQWLENCSSKYSDCKSTLPGFQKVVRIMCNGRETKIIHPNGCIDCYYAKTKEEKEVCRGKYKGQDCS